MTAFGCGRGILKKVPALSVRMPSERSKEIQRNLAGFVVAAGCVVLVVGAFFIAGAVAAQKFWSGATTIPTDIQAIIDDAWRKGLGSLILGAGLAVGGWLWHRDVAEPRSG